MSRTAPSCAAAAGDAQLVRELAHDLERFAAGLTVSASAPGNAGDFIVGAP